MTDKKVKSTPMSRYLAKEFLEGRLSPNTYLMWLCMKALTEKR